LAPDQELATLRRAIPWFIPASVAKSVGPGRAAPDLASPRERYGTTPPHARRGERVHWQPTP
jgi:hypothetical protein